MDLANWHSWLCNVRVIVMWGFLLLLRSSSLLLFSRQMGALWFFWPRHLPQFCKVPFYSCNAIWSLFKDFWNWFSVNPGASLLRLFHDILIGFLQYLGLFPLCDGWIINDCDRVFGPVFGFELMKMQVLNALSTLKCKCGWIWTKCGSIQIVETPVQLLWICFAFSSVLYWEAGGAVYRILPSFRPLTVAHS